MNCGTFKGEIRTDKDWRAKHQGHRITEGVHTVKAPGYNVVFKRCEDCSTPRHKVEHGQLVNTREARATS